MGDSGDKALPLLLVPRVSALLARPRSTRPRPQPHASHPCAFVLPVPWAGPCLFHAAALEGTVRPATGRRVLFVCLRCFQILVKPAVRGGIHECFCLPLTFLH